MSPKNYAKFYGTPMFGHSVSIGFMPANWIIGLAFGPKWVALHIGPFNLFWHRPKEQSETRLGGTVSGSQG